MAGKRNKNVLEIVRKELALEKVLPDVENILTKEEREIGLHKISYETFVYAVKRYSYKGTPLQELMFKEICTEINVDYSKLDDASKDIDTL
jgi:hypothetical protein